ncbi:MAG: DUF1667 domain-containing protein [Lachnospiraceae bacterium]|nr:DUF1667 domain-containing protein [Lachnospiraceae bacterium]
MEKKNLICIGCPLGCPLAVTVDGGQVTVSGNTCPRGDAYARKEISNPTRIVTSSIPVENGALARVSVKTERDIPKGKIFEVMKEIRSRRVAAPVETGQVLIENCAGTGVNIIATKTVNRRL